MTTPETHPHQVFRLAWFDPASPGVIVDNSIHLTTGSARKCAAAMAKDAPELRAHGSRVFITDAHRKILDDLQTNPVPWMSLDEQFFIAGPWANNAWWTNSIGPNVVQPAEIIASGGGEMPAGAVLRIDCAPIVMDQPTGQQKAAEVITGQDANTAMLPLSPVVPQATVQPDSPAVPAYVPIAASVAYVPRPEPRPLPVPPAPPSDDKVISAYAIEWTDTGPSRAEPVWSLHDGVPSIFALAESNLRRRPQWRPTAHICLVSARTDASRREAETGAEGAYWVATGAMPHLTDRLEKCDAPWVQNLMASYATPDKWEGIAADLRAQGYSTTVAGHVPAAVPAAPEATPTATEEIAAALDAAVAEPKEASLPSWMTPKAPPAPPPAPAVAAPTVMASGEEPAKKRGRKPKDSPAGEQDSPPAEPKKRGRKPRVSPGETAPLALDIDADIRSVVAPTPPAPAPMAAVQGSPVVVPGDTWDRPGAIEEAAPTPFAGDSDEDREEAAACDLDAAIAVAAVHVKRAMGRIRLAAHAIPMATHERQRSDLMATLGGLSCLLADLEGEVP